jgi:3-hydroxyacyl-[acyl-carrier-protein] dehydratase
MELNKSQILDIQKNRDPYLMMDYVTDVKPGISSEGYKDLIDDWFFEVHWKNDPNMPGMLQIESLVQMASISILTLPNNKGKILYLTSANKIKFHKKVLKGDRLILRTKVNSWKRGYGSFTGQGFVKGNIACQAEFSLVLPDELKLYKK